MNGNGKRLAVPALTATFAVQTIAAMAMFGVSVIAPVAASDIGVNATLVGAFTGIAYGSGLVVGLLSGRLADRFGALRTSQGTMVFALTGLHSPVNLDAARGTGQRDCHGTLLWSGQST